jgi:hypothetical protein
MRRIAGLASVLLAPLLGACTGRPEATPLDPLFAAPSGEGEILVRPVRPAPVPEAAPTPERCKHVYEPHSTHSYVDPLTGLPALCAVTICRKCGEIRHECSPPPRR